MTPTNTLTADQFTAVDTFLDKVVQAVINFVYTFVSTIVDYLVQPEVLGALVTIGIMFIGYKWFKRKNIS